MKFDISPRRMNLILFFAIPLFMPIVVFLTLLPGYAASVRCWQQAGLGLLHLLLFSVFACFAGRRLAAAVTLPWYFLVSALTLTDLFLWLQFDAFFGEDILILIINTNPGEAAGFGRIYLFSKVTLLLLASFVLPFVSFLLPLRADIRRTLALFAGFAGAALAAFVSPADPAGPPPGIGERIDRMILYLLQAHKKIDLDAVNRDIEVTAEKKNAVYVLVIGESHSRRRSSCYGWPRETMPLAGKRLGQANFFRFDDVVSPHSVTMMVLPKLLSFEAHGERDLRRRHNIVDIFRKAGFKTWYLTNQPPPNEKVSYFDIARRADVFRFESDGIHVRDEKLAESLHHLLQHDLAPRKFVILHLAGSHWPYDGKCPPGHRKFPEEADCDAFNPVQRQYGKLMNKYDNSLVYTDFVLDRIFRCVEEHGKRGFVLYLPDHGEALYEDGIHYGHTEFLPLPETVEIPMLLFLSEGYMRGLSPERLRHMRLSVRRPWNSEDLPFLLLDLAGLDYRGFDPARSLINPNFKPRRRIVSKRGTMYDVLKKTHPDHVMEL